MQTDFNNVRYMSNYDIYTILRHEILNLEIVPGQLLSENVVSKRFNVSRTPIRSVFDHLIKDDLLQVIPRKGTFVTLLDLDAIDQILYMRSKVEVGVMTVLTRKPDKILFEKLSANLRQQELELNSGMTPEKFYELDSKFHELCMIAMNKHKLWMIIQQLNVHYSRYRMLDYVASHQFESLYHQHCTLLNCMVNGRVDKIEKYVMEHLYSGLVRIGDRLTTEFKDYFAESERSIHDILEDYHFMIGMGDEGEQSMNRHCSIR